MMKRDQVLNIIIGNFLFQKYAGSDGLLACRPFLPAPQFMVIGPVLEDEAVKIHQTFWS